jgi:hypothetical protein
VGDPTMVDPEPVTAMQVVKGLAAAAQGGDNKVSAETTSGPARPSEQAPRSDTSTATTDATPAPAAAVAADPNELKPNVEPDPNALPPLQQSNQLESGSGGANAQAAPVKTEEMADIASSKKKKKKGLAKLNPF